MSITFTPRLEDLIAFYIFHHRRFMYRLKERLFFSLFLVLGFLLIAAIGYITNSFDIVVITLSLIPITLTVMVWDFVSYQRRMETSLRQQLQTAYERDEAMRNHLNTVYTISCDRQGVSLSYSTKNTVFTWDMFDRITTTRKHIFFYRGRTSMEFIVIPRDDIQNQPQAQTFIRCIKQYSRKRR